MARLQIFNLFRLYVCVLCNFVSLLNFGNKDFEFKLDEIPVHQIIYTF